MTRSFLLACGLVPIIVASAAAADAPRGALATIALVDQKAADAPAVLPHLTVEQIVDKNVAARGGLDAWRKIQTMVWIGHIESARGGEPSLPFVLEMKRPNKTHFEINGRMERAARIYDGAEGWKVRAGFNSRPGMQPYTLEELKFAHDEQVIDGFLIDHGAKGIAVTLDGTDDVKGRPAYRLSATLPSGAVDHIWVDAQTFLELRSDREFRNPAGLKARSTVYYGDFRAVEGLQIPFLVETTSDPGKPADKLVIEKVSLNPPLEDRVFAQPGKRHVRGAGSRAVPPRMGHQSLRPVPGPTTGPAVASPQAVPGAGNVH